VENLITNKSVAILEASRSILNARCVKIYVLANVKKVLKTSWLQTGTENNSPWCRWISKAP